MKSGDGRPTLWWMSWSKTALDALRARLYKQLSGYGTGRCKKCCSSWANGCLISSPRMKRTRRRSCFRPRAARPSRGAPQSKPTEVVEARPSRRQQLESLIQDGTRGGHCWQESHRGSTNLTISCSKCGLYVQQNDNACIFDRKTKQPCAGQAMDLLPGMHFSHKLESLGSAFICIQCKRVQRVGFSTLAPVFGKLCAPTQTCNSKLSKMWRQSRETQQHAPPAGAGGGQGGQEMRGRQKQTFKKNSVRNDDSGLVQPRLTFRPKPRAQDR